MTGRSPHLVVGYDRREASVHALLVAADLATRLQAHLHVVHAVDLLDYPIDPDAPDWEESARGTLDAERARVVDLMEGSVVDWEYHPERGDPVGALTAIADRHDALMIVVGTRGEGLGPSLQRLLGGGSVSHGLIRTLGRPVLIVPQVHDGPGSGRGDPLP